ncbi:hypothetical protein EXIGLDRAFT_829977 [Exidia glandulosa HHB12029]|uniref:Cep57 centrosome microtubule-binding domain-containing protein n=1 Tax=Exidia glandulosa HHB12029 TaxID=1314781 RepID=A0A165P192_EXIGL|nr:hypothetical protein EXIGLDRAFT_829977 [Exidia glandulosa HHB12029]
MDSGDWSIEHDDGGRERLREERELAGRLGSPDYSIELPRHIPLDAFDDLSGHSSLRPRELYSHRDDSLGHGETLSTAAHHASALTLSAGLAPRLGSPHASDQEFDPGRPLHGMLDIPTDISLFNITRTPKSARGERLHKSPKPAILDPNAELDRVARSGRFTRHARETDDAVSDVSTVARRSDIENVPLSPRLAEALQRQTAAFSPKRPRTQPLPMQMQTTITAMPAVTSTPSYHQRPIAGQQQRIPSNASKTASTPTARDDSNQDESKFERLARGIASDLYRAKQDVLRPSPQARAPFADLGNSQTPRPARRTYTPGKHRVQLPDVTGITAAVASPMRGANSYYDPDDDAGYSMAGPDAQAVSNAIEELAGRLGELEQENGAARRRVRELEMELDDCRAEVARERTRVLDAEARDRKEREKGKARASATANDQRATANIWESRYKEVVEEKKSLEALVTQLRSQLARMTRELESHQAAIRELRSMQERDAHEMRSKIAEIEELRAEVDRLSDEVERLRRIIEDSLQQRREHSQGYTNSDAGTEQFAEVEPQGLSAVVEEPTNELREEESMRRREREREREREMRAPSRASQIREVSHDNEWFHRTDGATAGSERAPRFIDPQEISRIEDELDERRTERSIQSPRYRSFRETHSLPSSRAQSPALPDRPPMSKASSVPAPAPAPLRAASRRGSRQEPQAQMPADLSIGGERLQRMFTAAPEHDERTCHVCHRRRRAPAGQGRFHSAPPDVPAEWRPPQAEADDEGFAEEHVEQPQGDRLPPQTVLARVLRELEDDFTHYKGLYIDLADQYKLMDAASNVVKRNVVAEQLKEVIDVLERKGDHIAALRDLLKYGDNPVLAENGWAVGSGDRLRARRR